MSNDSAVTPDQEVDVQQEGKKGRKKRTPFIVPEGGCNFVDGQFTNCDQWTTAMTLPKESDFQTERMHDEFRLHYCELKMADLQKLFDEKASRYKSEIAAVKTKLEYNDSICDAMDISDESQKAAIAETLAIGQMAKEKGISFDQIASALQMLAQLQDSSE